MVEYAVETDRHPSQRVIIVKIVVSTSMQFGHVSSGLSVVSHRK